MAPALTPSTIGQLIALYEHITFVEGSIWGINSFDQWGVELGKALALRVTPALAGDPAALTQLDASAQGMVDYYRATRRR
jgi:glucose-6-phosphate isomerase